ncbi:hypothetical protein SAMN05428953_107146 [Mesorhizobium muleiense]|uniref:Uncharacterized protein n=1 Tax=Mesorhizobium muleiense TaxID=1004279 RepID=A0A1G8V0W4_9HYPH|nr:hypothetical protein SAMN05428953_107146 [Mesorhizobium muleiense]
MAQPHIDDDGVFTLPLLVDSLDEVPHDFKAAYTADAECPDR